MNTKDPESALSLKLFPNPYFLNLSYTELYYFSFLQLLEYKQIGFHTPAEFWKLE